VAALIAGLEHGAGEAALTALEEFSTSLRVHFEVEESAYFGLLSRLRPDLTYAVSRAREAHVSMLACCEQVRSCLLEGDATGATALVGGLLTTFHAHEEHEWTLIRALEQLDGTGGSESSQV
jgi:hypothetical protein